MIYADSSLLIIINGKAETIQNITVPNFYKHKIESTKDKGENKEGNKRIIASQKTPTK